MKQNIMMMKVEGGDQSFEVRHQLLEIQPHELNFTFEAKKQSSFAVHLSNLTDHYVAFKVKTTSPKKYCVRPNIGIIKPKSSCDFNVMMQAQRSAPQDMFCKDKFLVQSTVAPFGAITEDITPEMFTPDSEKYIEECKLRVVLTAPLHSPVLLPVNGVSKEGKSKFSSFKETQMPGGLENLPPPQKMPGDIENLSPPQMDDDIEGAKPVTDVLQQAVEAAAPLQADDILEKDVESRQLKDVEGTDLKVVGDVEELKYTIKLLDSKLIQAEFTISKLKEERNNAAQGILTLKQESVRDDASRRKKIGLKQVCRGFPPLFVCMVAIISLTAGYLLHA